MVRLKQTARCPREKGQQISAAIQDWAMKRRLADEEEERKEKERRKRKKRKKRKTRQEKEDDNRKVSFNDVHIFV